MTKPTKAKKPAPTLKVRMKMGSLAAGPDVQVRNHSHYFKNVRHLLEIDVYRVVDLFGVTDHAIGHAIKKLLVAGGRGAGKDVSRDIQEAIDTLQRWQEMQAENSLAGQM